MAAAIVDPGSLRHELVLENYAAIGDATGAIELRWTPVARFWGLVEPLATAVRLLGQSELSEATHRVTLRMRRGIVRGMRLRRRGRIYEILSVQELDETGRHLVCQLREETA
ncbi:phage head closure protein [Phyllobacterium sp. 0TCS1.6C]|jgi:SPP1 family predicted phage head-tail adaptor|uniref:phage head closure protein n=1 Tax=unclassified Phyllobacterium TaxID=2638441 RepID=UPI002263FFEE|nr:MULTISPECIES: phage head closure protein [unclassified Phyllobacterium]MCX8281268.1 phage head closure protein [Phyllobacterium sp. 0TCS1.6C]MCX8296076.1 phage head closure protein [Phyllobacterium sp. 0TCS1.6A]